MNNLLALVFVLAHGGNPVATTIKFPPQYPDSVWATTTSQGIFARVKNGFRWLCEDAFGPEAGVRDFAIVGEGEDRWLVSTSLGLFLTTNRGCDTQLVYGPLRGHRPGPITANPAAPDEVVVSTRTNARHNDVFFTEDGGDTWTAAGLDVPGVTRTLKRCDAEPDRLYVSHEAGLARSDDGGRTFAPLPAPPDSDPSNVRFLTTDPVDPNVVFAYRERFPISTVFRSEDAGETWAEVLEVEDVSLGLVASADGGRYLLTSPLAGWWRSADGGLTWAPTPEGVPRIGCLARAPDGALHACANPIFMGPWVLGNSVDFGETWVATLDLFDNIESAWDCDANSRAWRCCRGLCPGARMGPECQNAVTPEDDPICAAPDNSYDGGVEPDVGSPDAGLPGDVGADPDAALSDSGVADVDPVEDPDARGGSGAEADGGGCTSADGARLWPLFALLLFARRRRAR